jgi:hypothetical protein
VDPNGVTDIVIVDPSHPLAAGLSGRVTVYTIPAEINWAANEVLAPGVQSVAALPDYPDLHTLADAFHQADSPFEVVLGERILDGENRKTADPDFDQLDHCVCPDLPIIQGELITSITSSEFVCRDVGRDPDVLTRTVARLFDRAHQFFQPRRGSALPVVPSEVSLQLPIASGARSST